LRRQDAPLLFEHLQLEVLSNRNLQFFITQELSNVLWSYAKVSQCFVLLY
jgi:hypothetical protein